MLVVHVSSLTDIFHLSIVWTALNKLYFCTVLTLLPFTIKLHFVIWMLSFVLSSVCISLSFTTTWAYNLYLIRTHLNHLGYTLPHLSKLKHPGCLCALWGATKYLLWYLNFFRLSKSIFWLHIKYRNFVPKTSSNYSLLVHLDLPQKSIYSAWHPCHLI